MREMWIGDGFLPAAWWYDEGVYAGLLACSQMLHFSPGQDADTSSMPCRPVNVGSVFVRVVTRKEAG
jgi:hypothetical protein